MDKTKLLEAVNENSAIRDYLIYDMIITNVDEIDKFIEYLVANYKGPVTEYFETKLRAELMGGEQ